MIGMSFIQETCQLESMLTDSYEVSVRNEEQALCDLDTKVQGRVLKTDALL